MNQGKTTRNRIVFYAQTAVKSFLTAWAMMRVCGLWSGSAAGILFFAGAWFFYRRAGEAAVRADGAVPKRVRTAAAGTAALIDCLWILGGARTMTDGLSSGLFVAAILLVTAVGLFLLLDTLFTRLFVWNVGRGAGAKQECAAGTRRENMRQTARAARTGCGRRIPAFWLTAGICLLCWLPYWAVNFPAVMTVDSFNQYAQATGVYAYSNHHPWVHTMFLKLCLTLGEATGGSAALGLSLYTVFQMCFMACCAGTLCATLERFHAPWGRRIGITAFYALLPFHGIFAVTVWKDVMFAGAFQLFAVSMLRMLWGREEKCGFSPAAGDMLLYGLSGVLVCLLRSNGWYAFLASVPFLVFWFRGSIKQILPLNLLIIAVVMVIKGPVMNAFEVAQPDLVESLSIPIQQVARVVAEGRELTEEEKQLLFYVIEPERVAQEYDARCSDNMKRMIRGKNPEYLSQHLEQFRALYLRLGLRYPGDYLAAWVDETGAYWYPEAAYEIVYNEGIPENEFGLESDSLFRGSLYLKAKEIYVKLYSVLPLYGLLFSMGAYTWFLLIGGGSLAAEGRYAMLAVLLPGLLLIGTLMVATPLNAELRYGYAVIFTAPVYWCAVAGKHAQPQSGGI